MKIAKIRKEKSITQKELAQLVGTTQQQVAKIEKELVDPKLSTLIRISLALRCELEDLFFTKREFLNIVNKNLKNSSMSYTKINFSHLAALCSKNDGLSTYHYFWEKIIVKKNKILFKEEQDENN